MNAWSADIARLLSKIMKDANAIRQRHDQDEADPRYYDRIMRAFKDAHADSGTLLAYVKELEHGLYVDAQANYPRLIEELASWKVEVAKQMTRAEHAETEVQVLKARELNNHHNAALCPYCMPQLEAQLTRNRELRDGLRAAIESLGARAERAEAEVQRLQEEQETHVGLIDELVERAEHAEAEVQRLKEECDNLKTWVPSCKNCGRAITRIDLPPPEGPDMTGQHGWLHVSPPGVFCPPSFKDGPIHGAAEPSDSAICRQWETLSEQRHKAEAEVQALMKERDSIRQNVCRFCGEDIRQYPEGWIDRETHTTCATFDDDRAHAPVAPDLEVEVQALRVERDTLRAAIENSMEYLDETLGPCEADCACILHGLHAALARRP